MMEKLIAAFPANITEAIAIANECNFSTPENEIRNIVVCGMGGSGIGGRLVGKWIEDELSIPFNVVHDYTLPEYVSKNTLVIGSSYSGNTEETLESINRAIEKGAHVKAICSGGKLKALCEEHGFDVVVVPGGNPPRTALAYSVVQLLNMLVQLNLISSERIKEIENARRLIESEEANIKMIAEEMADFLHGNVGILYGETKYEPMLIRARQQFNENSKLLCWHHAIPEMNHNELVGWGGGDERFATIFFKANDMHRRNAKRMDISKEIITKKSRKVMEVSALGNSLIERSIYFINIVDWASLFLAAKNRVDPIDIKVIDFLKGELANYK